MSVSDEERERLHVVLDSLLNARSTIEATLSKEVEPGMPYRFRVSMPLDDLFRNGSVFLRDVLGPILHQKELGLLFDYKLKENTEGADLLATLANSIRSFLPLFMRTGRYEGVTYSEDLNENIEKIISDFLGMYWGDEPRFFSSWPRRQGLHRRPYRLARLRLAALDWDKYLAVVGMRPFERHSIISSAYRTDWDAIRKWRISIEEQTDLRPHPPRFEQFAKDEYQRDPEAILSAIRRDGDAYWAERGSAPPGKQT